MKIAPLKVSDPWYGRIMKSGQVQAETLRSVPIEGVVEMELVELLHGGPESNYRPYLHLRGELTEAKPAVELPYGVAELVMRRGAGLGVDAFYDFNPRQLSLLVSKGYFTEEFAVPNEMSGIPWTLPGKADFLVVAPEYTDQPPLVFMNVHDQSSMGLDQANSGYDLAAYFHDYEPVAEEQATKSADVEAPARDGSGLDVFSDVDFSLEFNESLAAGDVVQQSGPHQLDDQRSVVPSGVFGRLISEIEARRVVEPEPAEVTEPEAEEGRSTAIDIQDVYESRVAPGIERVLAGVQNEDEANDLQWAFEAGEEEAPSVEPIFADDDSEAVTQVGGFLDLSEPEPELEPLRTLGESPAEAHRAAADRRAARIRVALVEDEAPTASEEAEPGL